jgi:signal transduction histidine kinase
MSSGPGNRIGAVVAAGVTRPAAPRPRWLRRGRLDLVFAADVVIALICFGATDGSLGSANAHHGSPYSSTQLLLVAFVVCAPLVLRNFLPLTAWVASALAVLWARVEIPPHTLSTAAYLPAGVIVYALCLYAVAVRCKTWVVVTAAVVTVIGASYANPPTIAGAIAVVAIPVFGGVIVRSRRASREQLQEQLHVQERRHEGERALLQERQRIARELHDVVAHHMSVIAIQAEAAPYRTADPPPELVQSFGEIRASALSGLSELRRVLGVLRSDRAETAPQPGLDDLTGLLESARSGGVTVTSGVSGSPRPLPDGVNLSAYRIVQEALSNAMRHAPGSAVAVKLYYGEAALVIEVRNDGCPVDGQADGQAGREQHNGAGDYGSGHGLIGMRERAAMLGGHLQAGPTGKGEFLVTAALPLGDREPEDSEPEGTKPEGTP